VLRRILGCKRNEVTRNWKKLHTEELNYLYFLPRNFSGDLIEKNEMGWTCRMYGREERCIQGLVVKPGGRRTLGRPRCRREDNIKTDLQEIGWRSMKWINLAQDRDSWRALVNALMKLRVS
jgi:hypothetical protein